MIALIAVLMAPQTPPPIPIAPAPRDFPAYVEVQLDSCWINQRPWTGPGRRVSDLRARGRAGDGTAVHMATGEGWCSVSSPGWRPQGDRLATTVREALTEWEPGFTVVEWRADFANTQGAAIRTTFERRNDQGAVTGRVEVVEPLDGTIGQVGVRFESVSP